MIKVVNLKKKYGDFEALKGISFEAKNNSITALLGPNGAGKTTTLRILSGYFYQDSGDIEFYGEKFLQTPEFKRMIGYVPENNPVYDDLEVYDYLFWIASAYRLGKKEVKKAIDSCSIGSIIGERIGTLSKGYKQRVSLAKAIIHNPRLLLLDEPTTGLDPNQSDETRRLINDMKKDKTIIISTHILSEVEMLCDDMVIINRGEVVLSGSKKDIIEKNSVNEYVAVFEGNVEIDFSVIEGFESVNKIISNDETIYRIKFYIKSDMRKDIMELIKNHNLPLREFYKKRVTLDEIFKELTEKNNGVEIENN
ncbi:MAG: ATP-binding cassette domain-containing protein [Elusimicrobiales bacterium]|nr:ATP-binding cassette domain-containing protein [Elusimicrobiales bacterium]